MLPSLQSAIDILLILFRLKAFISEDNRLHTPPIIPFIPQPGYTHRISPIPTALPPAHPVSCAERHFNERIIFCNRGCSYHPLPPGTALISRNVCSNPSRATKWLPPCRIIMARNGFRPLCHTAKRKYIGMCACPIQFVKPLYNPFSEIKSP